MIKPFNNLTITLNELRETVKVTRKFRRLFPEYYSDTYQLDYSNMLEHLGSYVQKEVRSWTRLGQMFQYEFNLMVRADEHIKGLVMYIFERLVFAEIDFDIAWAENAFRRIIDRYKILEYDTIWEMDEDETQELYKDLFKSTCKQKSIHIKRLEITSVMESLKMLDLCLACLENRKNEVDVSVIVFDRVDSELIKMIYFYYMSECVETGRVRQFYLEHVYKLSMRYEDRRIHLWAQLAECKMLALSEKNFEGKQSQVKSYESWCNLYKMLLFRMHQKWVDESNIYKDVRRSIPLYIRDMLKAEYYKHFIMFHNTVMKGLNSVDKRIVSISRHNLLCPEEYYRIKNEIHSLQSRKYYDSVKEMEKIVKSISLGGRL